MSEPLLREEMICLSGRLDVVLVDTDSNAREHVLRACNNTAVDAEEVGALESLDPKVIVIKVTIIDNLRVQTLSVVADDLEDVGSDQRGRLFVLGVHVVEHDLHTATTR